MIEREKPKDTQSAMSYSARDIRGVVMQMMIEIESLMNFYMAMKFCNNSEKRAIELIVAFLNSANLTRKGEIFECLVKDRNKRFARKYPWIFEKISGLIVTRNMIAHWPISFGEEPQKQYRKTGSLYFVKISKQKKKIILGEPLTPTVITTSEINTILQDLNNVSTALAELTKWHAPPNKR
jgi:hypothetical protein